MDASSRGKDAVKNQRLWLALLLFSQSGFASVLIRDFTGNICEMGNVGINW